MGRSLEKETIMKVYYIAGLLFVGIFGTFSLAHANEVPVTIQSSYNYQQPVTHTNYTAPAPKSRRVVRVVEALQPRAVLVNGTYVTPDMAAARAVARPTHTYALQPRTNAMPNHYRPTTRSNMPVMFSRSAMQAR